MLNCQGCHLPSGEGYPERGVPRLRGEMGKFLSVEGGRAYLVQVPGVAFSDLADDRLASVLNWVLSEFSPAEIPEDFEPYTAQEVADLRSKPLIEVAPVREMLVDQIQAAQKAQGKVSSEDMHEKEPSHDL